MSARIKRKPAKYLEEGEIPAVQSPQVRTPTPTTTPTPTPPKLPSKRKLEAKEEQNKAAKKPFRSCEKQRCPAKLPICFTNATEKCAGDTYTSRWYHMSAGEHFCNECFDHYYRSHREGYKLFSEWKREWSKNGKTDPNLKTYMADQVLPYWVQCNKQSCKKWRPLPPRKDLTKEIISSFVCDHADNKAGVGDSCEWPQDPRVNQVFDDTWLQLLMTPPLLKRSPAAQFLSAYFPDGVGLSPTSQNPEEVDNKSVPKSYFQPFYQPDEQGRALCVCADVMDFDEVQAFPQFAKEQQMYLAVRNLILALWARDCKEFLTESKCAQYLLVRGLVRISCSNLLESVLVFLTRKGLVNTGLLTGMPTELQSKAKTPQETVVVIGAGAAGLAAARHLNNFNHKVIVLEARNRIGGRVWDVDDKSTVVGRGAQIINGCINNPFMMMCEQAGFEVQELHHRCMLVEDGGQLVDSTSDKKVDFHFNAMLDAVAEWRRDKKLSEDVPLGKKLLEMHKTFQDETDATFTSLEERLLQFHISNLEYACGSHLTNVSSLHWDQNEAFAQFAGDHVLLSRGYSAILEKLSSGLDVRMNQEVKTINHSNSQQIVKTKQGLELKCSRVIVTLPLSLLQEGRITFEPSLPSEKTKAIYALGAGITEKVILEFPIRFWSDRVQGTEYFGRLPTSAKDRGFFSVFYDMTGNEDKKSGFILMSVISGEAAEEMKSMTTEDIISKCMTYLRGLFPNQSVPEPTKSYVTEWYKDSFSKMSYSYIKPGGSGEVYETLADSVNDRVFFAGEATNRQFPQTVTGAYLSGIREATKIMEIT
ncbi:putative lysine-specific histone demethylase 1B [Apostichopus japonicus]|uniref:Putative lysine-specific histone demethylase 1B n=1 Tax=Stichopus japonicus TaxID=307972 RepID=A0A2G8L509_STIJA|nr:putative lysine-specific histone demethylase 1B [Apostichopus japonicus]